MEYKSPKTVFQEKINNIIKKEKTNIGVLEHIFKLQNIYSFERIKNPEETCDEKTSWIVLFDIYNLLGPSKFAEMLSIVQGRTLSLPTEEEYEDSLITALSYYYMDVKGYDWDKIKDKLEIPTLNAVKYGIKVRALKRFIESGILKHTKEPK